jgi:hypothetical protein
MWIKIVSIEHLKLLPINTIIIKYPVIGEPEDNFGGEDNKNSDKRKIIINNIEFREIELESIESIMMNNLAAGVNSISYSSIKLTYRSIIEEGKYWSKE